MPEVFQSENQIGANFLPVENFCFLNIFKPKGITSFDVIYKLRKHLNIKKIGHSGTLDPLAEGVMQVGVGKAAKLLEYLNSDKKYIATVKFGFTSDTLDSEGVISKVSEPAFSYNEFKSALDGFIGEIEQTPPIYSAIKVGGKKLCDVARKNKQTGKENNIEIPKRKVTIYEANILTPENSPKNCLYNEAKIEISCSKGTYIRSLVQDLAIKLGTGAYLTSLLRTAAGNFTIDNSVKINEVDLDTHGISPVGVINLLKYELTNEEYVKVLNGSSIRCKRLFPSYCKNNPIGLIFRNNLVSIAILSDNNFICKKVFKPD